MVILIILVIVGLLIWSIFEIIVLFEEGSPISERDISYYLDKIERENLIQGVTKRWNDKFVLKVKGFTHRHNDNPNIYQTQYSLLFPYHITDVGVIPIWSRSYIRLKTIFKENIENSVYKTDKRKKLGLD